MIQMYPNQDVEEWLTKKKNKDIQGKPTSEEVIETNSNMYANVGYKQGKNDLNVTLIFFFFKKGELCPLTTIKHAQV